MRLSDIMGRLDLSLFPQIALVLFLLVFGAVTIRLFSRRHSSALDAAAMIPLEDDRPAPSRDCTLPKTPTNARAAVVSSAASKGA